MWQRKFLPVNKKSCEKSKFLPVKKSLVKIANFYRWRRQVFYRISSSCFEATWSVNNDCPVPSFVIIIDLHFLTAGLIEGKMHLYVYISLDCQKFVNCIVFITSNVTFAHFSIQIIISNISFLLQTNRLRVPIGDQGCTWVGSRVPTTWHPWSLMGALCFLPVDFRGLYLWKPFYAT